MMLVWMQRSPLMGHGQNEDLPLLTGIVFVIAVDTGEVLDFHVLSNECHELSIKKSQCHTTRSFTSGSLSILLLMTVILISVVAHLQWKLRVPQFCGTDLSSATISNTNRW